MHQEGPRHREKGRTPGWRPKPTRGGLIGIAVTSLCVACSAAAWLYALGRPIGADSFVAVVAGLAGLLLALLSGALSYGYYSMRYQLDGQALTVAWLWTREIVPLGQIRDVYRGHRLGKRVRVEGVTWPGHYVGTARAEGLGQFKFYGTTQDPSDAVLLSTDHRGWAITPADLPAFRADLLERLQELPEEEFETAPEPRTESSWPLRISLLRDGVALGLLAAALLVLLGSFGYVSARLPSLPELMPLRFNLAGEPVLIRPAGELLHMPLIGLLILGANSVVGAAIHRWQRDASRILAAATVVVELMMLAAVAKVVQ